DTESPVEVAHRCDYWVALISSSWKTGQLGREAPSLGGQTQLIGWRPGDEGWFTLSTDGSFRSPTKVAAAGGLIRDDSGRFVKAFAANLGRCSITRAEMRAIVDGLKLAWTLGIRRIRVQSDSRTAIAIFANASDLDHQHAALVMQFKELCSRQWEVHLSHIYREANYAADYLANLGHSFIYGLHFLDLPDRGLFHWLNYDLIGVSLPRLILLEWDMARTVSEEAGAGRTADGISGAQRCQAGETMVEWRSSDQVVTGTPSTSPPYWDTDDDDDGGLKPSELYGKYTWKIDKFSQINKRELRSNVFEVGGYKWYILIYPQGCDVCNHLSLFLCVANHDKLLPGWSHFAQFTIAVVNKDPKKSKYSDTLHRFWKKEHDWGWKKFMELSKVGDGFLDAADTLIIKAQVQVISFCSFWLEMDQNAQRRMSREKMDVILKIVVKHFFIEKEVTSTLVMDSLYSGLKALEGQAKNKKGRVKNNSEEIPAPIVHVEKDTFVLIDDVLLLLERAAMEPLPPKDDKGPQNRTKDGNSGDEFTKDSIERDERRLTELGRRTVEIFVLAHIFNHKIEVAYQEAVALKRQEELIREEEEAGLAEAKRGAAEKEKKSKKKQAKQKRNNRKGKEKCKEERPGAATLDNHQEDNASNGKQVTLKDEVKPIDEKPDVPEDVSDVSDSIDGVAEVLQLDSEDRDASTVNWDTDTSEVHLRTEDCSSGVSGLSSVGNGTAEKRSVSAMDDSSSTCSTDSLPSVVMNGSYKGSSFSTYQCDKSPNRGKTHRGKMTCNGAWGSEAESQPSGSTVGSRDLNSKTGNGKSNECEFEPAAHSLQDTATIRAEHHMIKRDEKVASPSKKPSATNIVELEKHSRETTKAVLTSPRSPCKTSARTIQVKPGHKVSIPVDASKAESIYSPEKGPVSALTQNASLPKPEIHNASALKLSEKPTQQQVPLVSRPASAPLVPAPRPATPAVSMPLTSASICRSVSATGRLGPESHSYIPQSYRNAIVGNSAVRTSSSSSSNPNSPSLGMNLSTAPTMVSPYVPQSSERADLNAVQSGYPFSMMTRDVFQNGHQWMESPQRDGSRSMQCNSSSFLNEIQNLDLHNRVSRDQYPAELPSSTYRRQNQGVSTDEFPHLDIINDLLDDEHVIDRGVSANVAESFNSYSNSPHLLSRQSSFPCDLGASGNLCSSSSSSSSSSGSCRFERTRSYQDQVYRREYSSFGGHYDTISDYVPHLSHYTNGQMDTLISNQWQYPTSADFSLAGMRNAEGDASPYFSQDYPSSGYNMYRPSNGH
ncbi:TNF receptor-associated factor homolog 1b, partial [Linum grandiflorum]